MDARQVRTKEDAKCIVEERGLSHVKLGVTDIDGIMRGKYVSREKFFSILEKGMSFCDVVLGWDSNDQLYDNVTYTGWHTAYPDAPVRIVPESCRDLPVEGDMLFFLAEFDKQAEAICPRGLLRRVLKRASGLGYAVESAVEFEFFVFEETPRSVREKGYRDLKPITPGYFGYSVLRSSVHADFYAELLRQCEQMGIPIEGLHTETGPGVLEAAITHSRGARSRRPGGALQDLHQGARAKARLDGELHGQMVAELAGPKRPSAHVALRPARARASSTTPRSRMRCRT